MKRTFEYAALTLVIASIMLVWVATMSDPAHLKWSTWAYSEWRISYDAGFIRRGLGGWVIDRLPAARWTLPNCATARKHWR